MLGLSLLCSTESGYAEQLFQFLQATAQEDGFFGESQTAKWCPGGRALLPSAGQCQPHCRKESCRVERATGCSLSPALGGFFFQREEEKPVPAAPTRASLLPLIQSVQTQVLPSGLSGPSETWG